MKRVITFSFCLWLVSAFCFSFFAQDMSTKTKLILDGYTVEVPQNQTAVEEEGLSTSAGTSNSIYLLEDAIIYDQTGNPGSNGSPSQFFPDFLGAGESADDFTVPAGEVWTVDTLYIVGTYSTTGGYVDLDVNIYLDDGPGGVPGTLFDSRTGITAATAGPGPIFTIPLTPPLVLPEGHHWLNFMVNMPFNPEGQFFWSNSNVPQIDSFKVFRDTTDLFGTGLFATWASTQGTPVGGGVEPDLQYAYYGSVGTAGPNCIFTDDFNDSAATAGNWSAASWGNICDWGWYTAATWAGITGLPPNLPPTSTGGFVGSSSDACGTGQAVNAYLTSNFSLDLSSWQTVTVEFEGDMQVFGAPTPPDTGAVDVSTDGGATWTRIALYQVDFAAIDTTIDISGIAALESDVRFRFCYYGDFSWHFIVDNFAVCVDDFIPVELSSFTASVSGRDVTLNWSTASETNNQGFDVERNSGNGYEKIGYLPGFGTTTEPRSYTFTDAGLTSGNYTYRLKQIDFDGTTSYSEDLQVEVSTPDVYALEQNYPNPFNPSTKIVFSLANDSKVSLKVFDVLGQEVMDLVNTDLTAGSHEIDFNASNLGSGIYFYRLEATGVDGANFIDIKKMTLTK